MVKRRQTLEAAFSVKLRIEIGKLGYRTWKISQQFQRGMPDIYMPTGRWIESKVIPWRAIERNGRSKAIKHFDDLQRWTMDQLELSGDTCLVAILWVMDDGHNRFMLMPWKHFRHILRWPIDTVFHFSQSYYKGRIDGLPLWFEDGKLSDTEWRRLFYTWERRKNAAHYDATQTSDYWEYLRGKTIGGKSNAAYVPESLMMADVKELEKMEHELDGSSR